MKPHTHCPGCGNESLSVWFCLLGSPGHFALLLTRGGSSASCQIK